MIRAHHRIAPWSEWSAGDYLREYYASVEPDEQRLLEYLVEIGRDLPRVDRALDFGCGPTVHRLFPLADRCREIHLADYLETNRRAVGDWLAASRGAHDWRPFARETLRLESGRRPGAAAIAAREATVRRRVTRLLPADASKRDPLGRAARHGYPLVTSHYCADSATADEASWRLFMKNIAGLVAPGGTFVVSLLGRSAGYRVGRRWFPGAGVGAPELADFLEKAGFVGLDLRVREVPDRRDQGYESVVFARAVRRRVA